MVNGRSAAAYDQADTQARCIPAEDGSCEVIWAPEKIEELKMLWERGDSATIISRAIGFSRNAVLGKVHRLGLSSRHTTKHEPLGRIPSPRLSRSKTAVIARAMAKMNVARLKAVKQIKPNAQTFSFKTPLPELTKTELRAMLKQAVINTAAMQ
jgi:hypothetical protein